MGKRTVTRVEAIEKEEDLDVCDLCGCDERGIDDEFKTIGVTGGSTTLSPRAILEVTDRAGRKSLRLAETRTRTEVGHSFRDVYNRLPDHAENTNPGIADAFVELKIELPDYDNEKLLCPHCFEGLFGDDE